MSFFSALARLALHTTAALPESSRSFLRGDAEEEGFAVVCKVCGDVVSANFTEPEGIAKNCRCGSATTANWRATTTVMHGWFCANCGLHLFYGAPEPSRWTCSADGTHDPAPVLAMRLRD